MNDWEDDDSENDADDQEAEEKRLPFQCSALQYVDGAKEVLHSNF